MGWVGCAVEEEERVERKVEEERPEVVERRRVEELREDEVGRVEDEEEGTTELETIRALTFLSFEGMMVGGPRGRAGGRLEDRITVCWRGRRAEEEEVPAREAGREVVGKAEGLGGWMWVEVVVDLGRGGVGGRIMVVGGRGGDELGRKEEGEVRIEARANDRARRLTLRARGL